MKTVKVAEAWGWQKGCSLPAHVKCICLWMMVWLLLSATCDICCFTFLFLSFQPKCVCPLKRRGGGDHTRQELIFQAANSHSRRSFFSLPKWKDRMKALTLYMVLGGTELMRLFSASGALLCLYVFLSFWSLHIYLSLSTQGTAATPSKELPLHLVPWGSFHSCDL